ncbi:hypothetical protein C8Q76DRAFT_34332 [Earliella scabrosa]|nr:hypothetical protein C8Q76DRAFT_34332 [Earliella scabrosa]
MCPTISSFCFSFLCFVQSLLEPVKSPATPTPQAPPSKSTDGQQKGNVKTTNGATIRDAHAMNGTTAGASTRGDQRRVMNVNKRKLDAHNGPESTNASSAPSSSKAPVLPVSPGSRNGALHLPASLPPRPSAATVASSIGGAPHAPRAERQRERQAPPHLKGKASRESPANVDVPAGTAGPSTNGRPASAYGEPDSPHSAKRSRIEGRARGWSGDGTMGVPMSRSASSVGNAPESPAGTSAQETKPVPSLLSRLATSETNGKAAAAPPVPAPERDRPGQGQGQSQGQGRRNKREREADREGELPQSSALPAVPAKRRDDPPGPAIHPTPTNQGQPASAAPPTGRGRQSQSSTDPDMDPVGGYSIRGAAKAVGRGADGSGNKGPGSLLERMQAQSESSGSDGGGRRKKRTKHS